MRCAIIIPARLKSTRLPNKPLAKILGKEMILHVCDALKGLDAYTVVATDSHEIKELCNENGHMAIITDACRTGTDRVFLACKEIKKLGGQLPFDIIVNVQGDEPLVCVEDVKKVIEAKIKDMEHIIATKSLLKTGDLDNINVVKVSDDGELTRQPIETKYRQQGIYAFTYEELKYFHNADYVETESIELTRIPKSKLSFVEIKGSHAVDIEKDIQIVELLLGGVYNGR